MNKIAIYAKSGTETGINEQIESCKEKIKRDLGEKALENIVIYKDLAPQSFEDQKSLKKLVQDVSSNEIKTLYIENIYTLSRSMDTIYNVSSKLLENNCKINTLYNLIPITQPYLDDLKKQNDILKRQLQKGINKSIREIESTRTIYRMLNVEVNNFGNDDSKYDNVFWYGGNVASIKSSQGEYIIAARGIVSCDLIAKKDFIDKNGEQVKEGDIIVHVKDKNESGIFKKEMSPFIHDDRELNDILCDEHDMYELDIDNNNWFELAFYNNDKEIEYDEVLDSNTLKEAINDVLDMIWEQNKNGKLYGIYCRVDHNKSSSKMEIENQKQVCLSAINRKATGNTELIKVYIDKCSGLTNLTSNLGNALKDIKEDKIEQIYVPNLSRLSRNLDSENMIETLNTLDANDSDIYLVQENKYLNKDLSYEISVLNSLKENLPIEKVEDEMEEIEYE